MALPLNLWLPETSAEEWDPAAAAGKSTGHALQFRAYLQDIDSRLDLVWVKDQAASFPEHCWNRWLMVRWNEGAPPTFWVVQDPDGGYCEPDERHLEALRAIDSAARPDVWRRHQQSVARRNADAQWRKDETHRRFREELADRLDHIFDARIAVPASVERALAHQGPTVADLQPGSGSGGTAGA
jgi:hypothetical protein